MMELAILNIINQENDSENKINIYRFDYIFVYIFFVFDKIIILLKNQTLRRRVKREKKIVNNLSRVEYSNTFLYYKNDFLEIKNKTKMNIVIIKTRNMNNDYDKGKNYYQKKIKHSNFGRKIIIRNYVIIIFILTIIINIFCKKNNNKIFNLFYFQDSKITLKIKGIGYYSLFGNEIKHNFTGINHLKEVKINGNRQNKIAYKYYFNQACNNVELTWDDNINHCGFMFWNCSQITEIDLSDFDTSQVTAMNGMFAYCSSLTSLDLSNYETSKVIYMNWMFYGCSSLTSLNLSAFDTSKVVNMNDIFADCSSLISLNLSSFDTSQVTNMYYMFYNCVNLEYINLINFNESGLSDLPNFYRNMFYNIPENVVVCINENIIKNKIFPQIKNKACFTIDCTDNWKSKQKGIINNNKCFEYNINDMSKEDEIGYYNDLLKIIEKAFTENYDTTKLDEGQDEIIKTEKLTITFTTSENQRNNLNNNMTSIDLGECEGLLRKEYNIPGNESIYIKKIDIVQEGMKTPKVEYDVYCKLFGTNLIKINLTACENQKISIYIPFLLTGNVDEYNSSSGYYNDICYTTTSEDGTDITLKDRKTNYIGEDRIICQEYCIFLEYEPENSKAKCSCNVKESSTSITEMTINKDKLLENFKDIKNFANFNFLVCYKKLFNKEGIINNIGSYLLLAIILFHIISIIIFYLKEFSLIKKKINNIISGINKSLLINKYKRGKINKSKRNNKNIDQRSLIENNDRQKMMISKKKLLNLRKNKKSKKKIRANIHINNINNNIIYNMSKSKMKQKYINNITTNKETKNNVRGKNGFSLNFNMKSKIDKINGVVKYIDEEINILPYNLALIYDKRSYCNYYISLLKTKHNLIFALNNNDYNSRIIKIDLFFLGFVIGYVVNALFYNDNTMHKIYENKGQFDLETQIPIIIYSSLISMVLNTLLSLFALSNEAIIRFKQSKSTHNLLKREENLNNKLAIQFVLYFIISFLLLVFFWYYISMFCVIYKNTQIHLLKDTLMSFGLSLLIPFGIYLLPGFFRIPSLSKGKNKRECLYNFSKILQLL